jgi:hypothetical protein
MNTSVMNTAIGKCRIHFHDVLYEMIVRKVIGGIAQDD